MLMVMDREEGEGNWGKDVIKETTQSSRQVRIATTAVVAENVEGIE